MAECSGRTPGPGYRLGNLTGYENHDISKSRGPAYSLGLKTYEKPGVAGPGPYNVGCVDRNGRYPYLGWTIESKGNTRGPPIGPGPLSYAPEKMKHYTPAYSLGLKLPYNVRPFGPSPADYFPQYSTQTGCTIGTAWRKETKALAPGPKPAIATDLYKPRAPAFSLGLKGRPMFGASAGPGPKYMATVKNHSPGYSFGLKHAKCAPPLITYEDNN